MRLTLLLVFLLPYCLLAKTHEPVAQASTNKPMCQAITAFGKRCKKPAVKGELFCRTHLNQRKKVEEKSSEYPSEIVDSIEEVHTIQYGTNGIFVVEETGRWIRLAGIASDNRTLPFIRTFCATNSVVCEYDALETKSKGRRIPGKAYIHVGERVLNVELVRQGLAGWDPSSCSQRHHKAFEEAENEARTHKRGFWSE